MKHWPEYAERLSTQKSVPIKNKPARPAVTNRPANTMKSFIISCCVILLLSVAGLTEVKAQCSTWPNPCGRCICVCTVDCSCGTICPQQIIMDIFDQQRYNDLFSDLTAMAESPAKQSQLRIAQKDKVVKELQDILSRDAVARGLPPHQHIKSHIGEKK